jgi:hypothetical protein
MSMSMLEVELDGIDTIVGGEEAIPHSRPYIVSLGYSGGYETGHVCGGSLISPRAVLTAAHCITNDDGTPAPKDWVDFNRHDLTIYEPKALRMPTGPAHQIPHPSYHADTKFLDFDVAVIILPTAVSGITPVTLNEDPSVPAAGVPLDVAGWGVTAWDDSTASGIDPSPVLKYTTLGYITNEVCTSPPFMYTPDQITKNMMCVPHDDETAECQGDSGMFLHSGDVFVWRESPNFMNFVIQSRWPSSSQRWNWTYHSCGTSWDCKLERQN